MYQSTQAPWQQPPRAPTEAEPPPFPRRRRDRRKVVAVLAVVGVAALVAALAGTKGFGLFDGIPGYRATYHDEAWGFTLSPPRPYVVKVDTETYDVRALLVFDPKVWDAEYPTWAAMTVICDRPDDYVQPSLADLTDSQDEWARDFLKDTKDELATEDARVQDARTWLIGGAPALEIQIWYNAGYDVGAWEDWIFVFGRDQRLVASISTTEAYGTGSFASLREVLETLEFDERQW